MKDLLKNPNVLMGAAAVAGFLGVRYLLRQQAKSSYSGQQIFKRRPSLTELHTGHSNAAGRMGTASAGTGSRGYGGTVWCSNTHSMPYTADDVANGAYWGPDNQFDAGIFADLNCPKATGQGSLGAQVRNRRDVTRRVPRGRYA